MLVSVIVGFCIVNEKLQENKKMYGDNVIYYSHEDKLKQKIAQPNNGEKS